MPLLQDAGEVKQPARRSAGSHRGEHELPGSAGASPRAKSASASTAPPAEELWNSCSAADVFLPPAPPCGMPAVGQTYTDWMLTSTSRRPCAGGDQRATSLGSGRRSGGGGAGMGGRSAG